jgi:hypothetical protein
MVICVWKSQMGTVKISRLNFNGFYTSTQSGQYIGGGGVRGQVYTYLI